MITDERMKELIAMATCAATLHVHGYAPTFFCDVYKSTLAALIENEEKRDCAVEAFAER